jgi:hypothetical protein
LPSGRHLRQWKPGALEQLRPQLQPPLLSWGDSRKIITITITITTTTTITILILLLLLILILL